MAKLSLAEYQAQFSQHLLSPHLNGESKEFLQLLVPRFGCETAELEAGLRLGIYRNNVMHSLSSALAGLYPVVKRLIGDECFNGVARDFIRDLPPSNPALLFYGKQFIEYLGEQQSLNHLSFLPDVARLEFADHCAFHGADIVPLAIAKLGEFEPSRLADLTFTCHPSLTLIESRWPIDTIWHENQKQQPETVDLAQSAAAFVLVYREQLTVQVVSLNEHCYQFLMALLAGDCIGVAWQKTSDYANENDQLLDDGELSPMLGYLFNLGVFTHCTLPPE